MHRPGSGVRIGEGRPRLTLADLMIAVALIGLAVFLISRPIHGRDGLEPYLISRRASPAELLLRIAGFAGGPLLAIARDRRRGRRGIAAGILAGIVCYGGYILLIDPYLPHHDPDRFDLQVNFLVFCMLGAWHGLILGSAAWCSAALVRLAVANRAARRRTSADNGR